MTQTGGYLLFQKVLPECNGRLGSNCCAFSDASVLGLDPRSRQTLRWQWPRRGGEESFNDPPFRRSSTAPFRLRREIPSLHAPLPPPSLSPAPPLPPDPPPPTPP